MLHGFGVWYLKQHTSSDWTCSDWTTRVFFLCLLTCASPNFILIGCNNILLQWRMYSEDLFDIKSTNQWISMCDSLNANPLVVYALLNLVNKLLHFHPSVFLVMTTDVPVFEWTGMYVPVPPISGGRLHCSLFYAWPSQRQLRSATSGKLYIPRTRTILLFIWLFPYSLTSIQSNENIPKIVDSKRDIVGFDSWALNTRPIINTLQAHNYNHSILK